MNMERIDICPTERLGGPKTAYDPSAIAELTRRIMGKWSLVKYAEISGVSKSWLSKAVNGKLLGQPSRKTLIRMWECSEDPTIQLAELLQAAGLEPDKPRVATTPESIVSTYLAGNPLTSLCVFMNALKLNESKGFAVRYERHRFSAQTDEGDKQYVCYPALCYGLKDAIPAVIAETTLNVIKRKDGAKANSTMTYVLTDEQETAKYFKTLSASFAEPFYVLFTQDYLTAISY